VSAPLNDAEKRMLENGRVVEAIKAYRARTGASLADAPARARSLRGPPYHASEGVAMPADNEPVPAIATPRRR